MRVCVWPPQISIRTQGRVTLREMRSKSACAIRGSRNSSTYFIDELENAVGLIGVDFADRETDMDEHVIAERSFGDEIEVSLTGDAAEADVAYAAIPLIFDPGDLTWDCQAHISL